MLNRDDRFRQLYGRYHNRLARFFVRNFHVAADEADDLVQETFIRFYRAMDEYRGDAEWAFFETVARNVAYNRIRNSQARKRAIVEESLESSTEVASIPGDPATGEEFKSPEDRVVEEEVAADVKHRLSAAIQSLPAGMRECLLLWADGFKYDEIAATLRISTDAVRSRLRDARKHLRQQMGGGDL